MNTRFGQEGMEILKSISDNVQSLMDTPISSKIDNAISNQEQISEQLDGIKQVLISGFDRLANILENKYIQNANIPITESRPLVSEHQHQLLREVEYRKCMDVIHSEKSKISKWKSLLSNHTHHFSQFLRNNGLAEIYKLYAVPFQDAVLGKFLPHKFRPKVIVGEPPEQTCLRIKHSFQSMVMESELLEHRAAEHRNKMIFVHNEMKSIIDEVSTAHLGAGFLELWKKEIQSQMEIAKTKWETKATILRDLSDPVMVKDGSDVATITEDTTVIELDPEPSDVISSKKTPVTGSVNNRGNQSNIENPNDLRHKLNKRKNKKSYTSSNQSTNQNKDNADGENNRRITPSSLPNKPNNFLEKRKPKKKTK